MEPETNESTPALGTTGVALSLDDQTRELELFRLRLDVYHLATFGTALGLAPMSASLAKQQILGMTAEQVESDLRVQFLEAKVVSEIALSTELIPSSGVFDALIVESKNAYSTEAKERVEPVLEELQESVPVEALVSDVAPVSESVPVVL